MDISGSPAGFSRYVTAGVAIDRDYAHPFCSVRCPRGAADKRGAARSPLRTPTLWTKRSGTSFSMGTYYCAASIVRVAQRTNRPALCTASRASLELVCLDSYSTTFFLARSILSCLTCEAMSPDLPPIS